MRIPRTVRLHANYPEDRLSGTAGSAYAYTSRPCRTLFRLLSPASIGQQKSRHANSLLLFHHSLPMSRPRASSHQAQTSWSAELPVPVPCTHFFYAVNMIMAGYVGIPCSYQQTLQNKGDHQQLQQLAHNNKTFQVRERSRFQSSESGPKHEAGRLARIIFMGLASKLY